MTDRHDGSSIDLERELVRYLAERRITRRALLDSVTKLGAAAALAPVIAACTSTNVTSAPPTAAPTPGATAASAAAAPSRVTLSRRARRLIRRSAR
jgi:hypothetical protein